MYAGILTIHIEEIQIAKDVGDRESYGVFLEFSWSFLGVLKYYTPEDKFISKPSHSQL